MVTLRQSVGHAGFKTRLSPHGLQHKAFVLRVLSILTFCVFKNPYTAMLTDLQNLQAMMRRPLQLR